MRLNFSINEDVYPLLKLILPLIVTGLVQSAVWFFETIFLSKLGPETLAAGAIVSWLFATIIVILFGTLSSINILVALKHGEKDHKGITQIARDGLLLALLLTIPTMILFWNIAPIFLWFGQSQKIVELAKPYLHALAWGVPADFLHMACLEVLIGIGFAQLILYFSMLTVTLSIIFSYLLIFGKFGFPALGIAGAGWGATISFWISTLILVAFIFLNNKYRTYFSETFSLAKPLYLIELIKIGMPIGVMWCFEVAFFFALTLCMGLISIEAQAANQVAMQYLGLFMSAIFSVAQAVTVRMGHLLGAKDIYSAEKANYVSMSISFLFTFVVAFFYWFTPSLLISIDFNVNDPKNFLIINNIKMFLAVSAIFQILEAIRITLFGSLRALKDTKFTMLVSIISFWCVALPIGYLMAFHLQLGGVGFWWAMVLGAGVSLFLLYQRFNAKISYQHKIVSERFSG